MDTAFTIRSARPEDKNRILTLIGSHSAKWDEQLAYRHYSDYFSNPSLMGLVDERVFVLTVENEILGVIGYSQDEYRISNYWLGWFYVHREYQGKGIGRELLEYILNELQQIGAKTIFVDTSSDALYRRALAIYLKSGFRIEAVIRNYYGKGEDQIILSKKFSYIGGFGA